MEYISEIEKILPIYTDEDFDTLINDINHNYDKIINLIKQSDLLYNFYNNPPENLEEIINNHPFLIFIVKDQNEKICKIALDNDFNVIAFIRNQTPELCHYAINIEPTVRCFCNKLNV